jgi:fumarate reductase subunit C
MIVSDLYFQFKLSVMLVQKLIRGLNTLATAGRSTTLYFGFPIVSTKIALVLSLIAAANASGLFSVTQFTPMPNFLNVTCRTHVSNESLILVKGDVPLNWLYV